MLQVMPVHKRISKPMPYTIFDTLFNLTIQAEKSSLIIEYK